MKQRQTLLLESLLYQGEYEWVAAVFLADDGSVVTLPYGLLAPIPDSLRGRVIGGPSVPGSRRNLLTQRFEWDGETLYPSEASFADFIRVLPEQACAQRGWGEIKQRVMRAEA